MRWFKHLTRSHEDEKLLQLRSDFGLSGYGFYWLVIEMIAQNMDKTDNTSLTFPLKIWAKLLQVRSDFVLRLCRKCTEIVLWQSSVSGQNLTITCDNLLKYRDEYTEKSRHRPHKNPDSVPSDTDIDTETDTEAEKDKRKKRPKKAAPQPPAPRVLTPAQDFVAWYENEHEVILETKYISKAEDFVHATRLIKKLGPDDLQSRATRFLSDPHSFPDNDKSLRHLDRNINAYGSSRPAAPDVLDPVKQAIEAAQKEEAHAKV